MTSLFKEVMKLVIFVVVIFTIVVGGGYWFIGTVDKGCTTKYAEDFCQEEGFEFKFVGGGRFICQEELNEREDPYGESHRFYFLEEEIEDCRTKEKYTFRKYAKDEKGEDVVQDR